MSSITLPLIMKHLQMLKREFSQRSLERRQYTLKDFAQDLGLSAPRLSNILNGKRGLSRSAAHQIAERLGFDESKAQYFCDLVDASFARSSVKRVEALGRIAQAEQSYHELPANQYDILAEWFPLAIVELTKLDHFVSDHYWIAGRLGISPRQCRLAIQRLLEIKALRYDQKNCLVASTDFSIPGGSRSNPILQQFQLKIIEKSREHLLEDSAEERDFSTMYMAVDESKIEEFRKTLKAFRRQLDQKFSTKSFQKNSLTCLSIGFFRLDKR